MSRQSILICDDNPDYCDVAAAILRAEGFDVDACRDVRLAIERVKTTAYSAIVVEPSPAAGFEHLLDVLASSDESLHSVVAATTENDARLQSHLEAVGVFRVLRKPFTRDALAGAVRDCCQRGVPTTPRS